MEEVEDVTQNAESKFRPSEIKELIKDFYESRIAQAV